MVDELADEPEGMLSNLRYDVRFVSISFYQVKTCRVQEIFSVIVANSFLCVLILVLSLGLSQVNYNASPNSKPLTLHFLLFCETTQ